MGHIKSFFNREGSPRQSGIFSSILLTASNRPLAQTVVRTKDVSIFFSFFSQPRRGACGLLVPRPGIEPSQTIAARALNPNH